MFQRDTLIRFHHCDPAGIVFYPQYFVLFNELVEDWFDQGLGLDFAELHLRRRLGIPLAHVECDFLAPSQIGERLLMELAVEKMGAASVTLAVTCRAADGQQRLRAKLVLVLASLETRRAVPFPPELRGRIETFRAGAGQRP